MAKIGEPQTWYKIVRGYRTFGNFIGIAGGSHFIYETIEDAIRNERPVGDYFIEEVTVRFADG